MARIYIARSTGIGSFERHVVLKMILPERAQDETSVQMFLDEARLAASLNHQNVAQVFEVGKEAGIHFLAMEYVHGQDLRALLARAGSSGTRVPLELALTVVAGAAAGLEHAHDRRNNDGTPMGIVHRDVSPSNIMIGYDGAVKLLDFGIAKAAARSVQTQSGIIKGKFAYMAPEQCRGRGVDRRSDVFSLGIILYEVTTQHRCFRADSDFDTMHRIVTGDIVRPTRLVHGYPQALEAIVMKALAVDVSQRYQSAGLLLEAIESFAAAARMSLSTMALGRFMRETFGDVSEPWQMSGRVAPPAPGKEQTISSTNGSSGQERPRPGSSPPPQRPAPSSSSPAVQRPSWPSSAGVPWPTPPPPAAGVPWPSAASASSVGAPWPSAASASSVGAPWPSASSASSAGAPWPSAPSASSAAAQRPSSPSTPLAASLALPPQHEEAPLHLPPDAPLDLPGEGTTADPMPDWSARGYPEMAPGYVAAAVFPAMPPQPANPLAAPIASGSPNPIAAPHAFHDQHRSESAAARHAMPPGAQPIARTRPGHANAPTVTRSDPYPRAEPQELDVNMSLHPSNRLLYAGLGVILVGIFVVLAISLTSGPDELPVPEERPSPSQASVTSDPSAASAPTAPPIKPEAFPANVRGAAGSDVAEQAGRRGSIHVRVVSTPAGAEVSLAGKLLGATPVDTEIERGSGSELLTIHRPRYQDATVRIDLGKDYVQTVTLTPIPEPSSGKSPASEQLARPAAPRPPTRSEPRHPGPTAKDDDCQPPDKINPYELACHGHVCRPCPPSTP